jgi:hypothetical protein
MGERSDGPFREPDGEDASDPDADPCSNAAACRARDERAQRARVPDEDDEGPDFDHRRDDPKRAGQRPEIGGTVEVRRREVVACLEARQVEARDLRPREENRCRGPCPGDGDRRETLR